MQRSDPLGPGFMAIHMKQYSRELIQELFGWADGKLSPVCPASEQLGTILHQVQISFPADQGIQNKSRRRALIGCVALARSFPQDIP